MKRVQVVELCCGPLTQPGDFPSIHELQGGDATILFCAAKSPFLEPPQSLAVQIFVGVLHTNVSNTRFTATPILLAERFTTYLLLCEEWNVAKWNSPLD